MKYLVMECHPGYAILLDEEGRFRKAANLHYKVGQTVRDPVWMRTERRRPARWVRSGIAAAAACLLHFLGVQFFQGYLQPYSFIYRTINPEVRMNLNRQGTVVGLAGTNADGEALLEGYDGRGKDKVTVADELIDRAIEMGFLSDGGRVSFSIDAPDEALFQAYGTADSRHAGDRRPRPRAGGAGQALRPEHRHANAHDASHRNPHADAHGDALARADPAGQHAHRRAPRGGQRLRRQRL